MKITKHYLFLLIIFLINACNFDTLENNHITDSFWITTIDLPENRSLGYSENKDGSYKSIVVSGTVKEIEWNEEFLLVKQQPKEGIKEIVFQNIRFKHWKRTTSRLKIKHTDDMYWDKQLGKQVDSLAQIELDNRIATGELDYINNPEGATLHYLININENPEEPIVILSNDSLEFYMDKLKVGRFTNNKSYNE
tara:strand:+ start:217 stop:798 length:582 start_codon:yes stop_codon:yes gene_type:complete